MDTVYAQQARQILDILVGFKISPVLWSKISTKTGLVRKISITGVTTHLRESKRINSSPGTKNYVTTGYFTNKNLPFVLNHNHEDESSVEAFLEKTVNHSHIYEREEPCKR